MRESRFTAAQIIGMIKEPAAGLPTSDLCRKHGLSPATFCKLKARYPQPHRAAPPSTDGSLSDARHIRPPAPTTCARPSGPPAQPEP